MRALVTGGGGFLGRRIAEKLRERNNDVFIFSRQRYAELEDIGCKSIQGDLRDFDTVSKAFKNIDVVFHVAALAGIWGNKSDFFSINVDGTINVINACTKNKITKLVYTSSPSVIFDMKHIEDGNESLPYPKKFYAHYPRSKAVAEQLILEANLESDIATCSLRPHLIWGPRDPHIIPMLISKAKSGQLARVGDGTNKVDITYVDNAADAHILAADRLAPNSDIAGQAYFIGDQNPVNLWEWINSLLRNLNLTDVTKHVPYKAAYCLGSIMELKHTLFPTETEPKMTRFLAAQFALSHYFSIAKAYKDFNYSPSVSNSEGIKKTVEWFSKHEIN